MNNLITTICTFAIFILKLTISQAYHIPPASQNLQYHRYHHHYLQQPPEDDGIQGNDKFVLRDSYGFSNDLSFDNKPAHHAGHHNSLRQHHHRHHHHNAYHYQIAEQQDYLNDLHLKQLTESAKDPKNLKNGIYHDGAVTYDLGSAGYEVLNPYDPPEIITSDHPHYHHHLNYIKKSNNFTIEDFGVTPVPVEDPISEAPSTNSPTTTADDYEYIDTTTVTTETPETTTSIATTAAATETTPYSIQPFKNTINDSHKNSDSNRSNSISSSSLPDVKFILLRINDDLRKKLKSASLQSYDLKNVKKYPPQYQQQFAIKESKGKGFSEQKSFGTMPPAETFSKGSKFAKSFYGQSILLPADHERSTNYSNKLRNTLPQSVRSPSPTLSYHKSYLSEDKIRRQRDDLGEKELSSEIYSPSNNFS